MSATTEIRTIKTGTTWAFPAVQDGYHGHVETFTQWMRDNGYTNPFEAVGEYFKALNTSSYSANTICVKRSAVKNRLRRMLYSSDITLDQQIKFEGVLSRLDHNTETKAPKVAAAAVGESKTITSDEYRQLIEGARSTRQRLMIEFLYYTGCRVSEMTNARLDWCKVNGHVVYIKIMGKGRKQREIRIDSYLFDEIRDEFRGQVYLFETSGGKPVRSEYASNQIANLAKSILGRRVSAHKLRHTWATRMVKANEPLQAVSAYLGHSTTAITNSFYVHTELSTTSLLGDRVLRQRAC